MSLTKFPIYVGKKLEKSKYLEIHANKSSKHSQSGTLFLMVSYIQR